jgi:nondiscriminating aspartyl-tRNA synthetase
MRILSHEIPSAVGQSVTVAGWVHRRRRLATVSFLILRDRSGLAQIVVKGSQTQLDELGEETVVQVTGTVAANPQAPGGAEIVDPVIEPLTEPAATPPIELWRPTVGAAAMHGFREALSSQDFTEIQTPKIVGTATESGANVFALDYFGGPAYLAQSPQFYKQQMVGVFERVFEVGPVFRAEPHDTVRHLAEYVSLDAEFGFITDHRDVLAVLRSTVAGMLAAVGELASGALERLEVELPGIPVDVPVVHFSEALKIAGADPDEPDLAPADERTIGEWARREHGSEFVAVEGYPMVKRPFYTHPQPSDPRWSNSFDLLFRGVELVTGGQRLHRYSDYVAALEARGESADAPAYRSYLQAFKHGMPPHGGFAIGLERFVARLIGAENVREVTLFPRDLHRLTP